MRTEFLRPLRPGALLIMALVQLTLPLGPSSLVAQDTKYPSLEGRRFIPTLDVRTPFPRTMIRTSMGIGTAADLEILPEIILDGDTISTGIKGDLLFATLTLEYEWALQEWMSLRVQGDLLGRLGTNSGALLSEGVTLLTGFELGWIVRLLHTETVQLSGTADFRSDNLTLVNLVDWVGGVLKREDVPLVNSAPVVRAGGGLRFAWAATDWFGVLIDTEAGYGEAAGLVPEEKGFFRTVGGLSFDLLPLWNVPLGLGVSATRSSYPVLGGDPNKNSGSGMLRLAYTGRDDFLLALDLQGVKSTQASGNDIEVGVTRISLQYFF